MMVSASIPSYMSVVYGCMAQRLPLTQFKENQDDKGGLHSVNSLEERGFCVARLIRIPNFSRASLAQQILAQIAQPVRITDRWSLATLYIVMAPQPFSRRFLGTIRSLTVTICNHGETRLKAAILHENLPQ